MAGHGSGGVNDQFTSGMARHERWRVLGQSGATIWLTGLSGAGKSTVGCAIETKLFSQALVAYRLDGDELRSGLCDDLGFDREGRRENVRRVGEVALNMAESGLMAIVSLISPYSADRNAVRQRHEEMGLRFVEVWLNTPLLECQRRDPKGYYALAAEGDMANLTGIDDPYEPPSAPDLELRPEHGSAQELAEIVVDTILKRDPIPRLALHASPRSG